MEEEFLQEPGGSNQSLPNANATLVLGIISIPLSFCFCWGFIGFALPIIALVISGSGKRAYRAAPTLYSASQYSNLKAGRACATVGLVISTLMLAWVVVRFLVIGAAAFSIFSILGELT